MSSGLEGKVVIVTGAGAGIGLGIVRQAVAAGARTIGFDISAEAEGRVVGEGGRFVHADVGDVEAFTAAIAEVRAVEGRIDGLVNNAGITINVPFLEMTQDQAELLWRVNHRAVLMGCQAAARIMIADGTKGSLVNVASNHARGSYAGYDAYAGTKGAIVAMGRAMAWSLGRHGIRVNALCPGMTMTERAQEHASDPRVDRIFRDWHATGDVNSVDDIGLAAVFLLSDASVAFTGAELIADRGMSARLGSLGVEDENRG